MGACWGSFLNVVAYRLIRGISLHSRSHCTVCVKKIAWYDLFPIISWLHLWGKCRRCSASISVLYPLIEIVTGFMCLAVYMFIPPIYQLSYFIFFSALIITLRTDIENMVVVRYFTLGLIPVGIMASFLGLLPLHVTHSIMGALFGYGLLWVIRASYWRIRNIEGMGEGDLELLAGIGSFIGVTGCWITLLIGSLCGSLYGLILIAFFKKERMVKIPFGPFLIIGATFYVFFTTFLQSFFFQNLL